MLIPWRRPRPQRRPTPSRCRPRVEVLEDRRLLTTFTVLNTGDNGGVNPARGADTGTLRQAVVDANGTPGPNTIQFQIGTGAQTIALQAPLPALTGTVTVDGTTQPGYAGTPLVEINGAAAGAHADGLVLGGNNGTVKGLAVGGFGRYGIVLKGNGNTLQGDYVGTDLTGAAALANGADGVVVFGINNTVGGTTAGAGNVVSGNTQAGIDLAGNDNLVTGNRVGTNAAGTAALANGGDGVIVYSGGDTIGGTGDAAGNLISGNLANGVEVLGNQNVVAGNRIGTDVTGALAVGNAADGVVVFSSDNTLGGTAAGAGNLVSGNAQHGLDIAGSGATGNAVQGNLVGTDVTGTLALGNGADGVIIYGPGNTVGGTGQGAGNLISGNAHHGVDLVGNENMVQANLIGTDAHGTAALGNGGDGVAVFGLQNAVGGTADGCGNVISGNAGSGVSLVGGSNTVQGDWIGTDLTGTAALGNGRDGAVVFGAGNAVGGNVPGAGNVLSGNKGSGVDVTGSGATGNVVQGNLIGTDATGTGNLGNAVDGIVLMASGNTVGDSTPAGANTVAFNQNDGVYTAPGTGNAVLQNNVFSNGPAGLPTPSGPTPPVLPPSSPHLVLVLPHPGRDTLVQVLDAQSGQQLFQFVAFPGLRTGLQFLVADLNGDGVPDIVVASTGRRHGGRVRVIDGRTGQQLAGPLGAFTAFSGGQGVTLSLADASGDGVPDLVVGARVAGRTVQKVYSIQTGALLAVLGGPSHRRHRRLR